MYDLFTDFERFAEDIEMMLGYKPGPYWKITWKFVTPFIIIVSKLKQPHNVSFLNGSIVKLFQLKEFYVYRELLRKCKQAVCAHVDVI